MEEKSAKHEQIQAIKHRLNRYLTKAGFSINQLTEAINRSDEPLKINYNTVKNALNYNTDALDITVAISICRYLRCDTAFVFSPPGTPEPDFEGSYTGNGKFIPLDDPKYFGKYNGYFYSPNHRSAELIYFELQISSENNRVSAKMIYHGRPVSVHGNVMEETRILYGVPYLCTRHSNIYIILTNDYGDFYFIYYNRQEFRSHSLYFRRGLIATASSLRDHPVMYMSFVLFARPVPKEKQRYIPGLLADVSSNFYISKDTVDQLRVKEPILVPLFDQFGYILEHNKDTVYSINETQILSSPNKTMSEEDIIKALLILKEHSLASKRTVYEDIESFSIFTKNFLQQP